MSHADGALYDPKTDSWAPMSAAGAPAARTAAENRVQPRTLRGFMLHDLLIVVGGSCDEDAHPCTTSGIYDPSRNTWHVPASSIPRFTSATLVGAKVLLWSAPASSDHPGWLFDPVADTVESLPPLPRNDDMPPQIAPALAWASDKLIVWSGVTADERGNPVLHGLIYTP